jgi:hypothetical protein
VNLNGNNEGFDLNGWMHIGSEATPFTGILNGNGYTIRNLWINKPSSNNTGLFGYTVNATVKNLGVELNNIRGGVIGKSIVGGLVGYAVATTLTNVHVRGNVNGTGSEIGGFSGGFSGTMTDSSYIGNIGGVDMLGGIAGGLTGPTITNVYAAGNISGRNYIGGISGLIMNSVITNSYTAVNISGNWEMGGIAGYASGGTTIAKNYAMGSIKAGSTVGGIVGEAASPMTITDNAVMSPSIEANGATNRIVGVFGASSKNIIQNNFALSTIGGNFTNSQNSTYSGINKSALELKTESTYSDPKIGDGLRGLGWLFGNNNTHPWVMPTANYPKLHWQK